MRLPIDAACLTFIAVRPPEEVVDFESKAPRISPDGRPIFAVEVVAVGSAGADILTVKVFGQPKGIVPGSPVRVVDLVATTWQMSDRHGVSFKAASIEAAGTKA
ncbi:MAG TPA: hypothetical protein VNV87_08735 [Acidimicrobiales bacterium]|jgi:hypothetical protein|nr:hypothetical protein [Acidimicrobiales bacterium]